MNMHGYREDDSFIDENTDGAVDSEMGKSLKNIERNRCDGKK